MEQKTNQIGKIKILKNQSKQIISDRKIHQKVKPTLLPDLTYKLMQLVEEIEEIEKIDMQLLQDNMKQFQNEKISLTILHERENLRDEIFCLSFFTPSKKNSDLKFHNYSRTIKKRFSKLTFIRITSQRNKGFFDRTSQKTHTYSIKRKNAKETPSLPQQTSQCLIHIHYDQPDHPTTRQNKKKQNQIIRTMQTKNASRKKLNQTHLSSSFRFHS